MSSGNKPEDYTSEDTAFWEDVEDNDILKEEADLEEVDSEEADPEEADSGGADSDRMNSNGMRWGLGRRQGRCNSRMLVMSVVLLIALCVLLVVRVRVLDGMLEKLTAQVENLTRLTVQQRDLMDRLMEETQSVMKDSAVVGSLEKGAGDLGEDPDSREEDPDFQGEYEEEEPEAAHKVYLTFDDGPGTNTQDILDILDEYDVKATFFVVGESCENNEDMLKKIVEAGHTLGMHSYSHDYSELYASVENFAEDLKKQQDYLYEVTGVRSTVYRFPGGSSNRVSDISMKEFARYLDSQGIRFFDWNISSGDGGSYLFPAETILENCTSAIGSHSTSIVLMHDVAAKTTTREALPEVIEKILDMEDTVILPITGKTQPVQHIKWQDEE